MFNEKYALIYERIWHFAAPFLTAFFHQRGGKKLFNIRTSESWITYKNSNFESFSAHWYRSLCDSWKYLFFMYATCNEKCRESKIIWRIQKTFTQYLLTCFKFQALRYVPRPLPHVSVRLSVYWSSNLTVQELLASAAIWKRITSGDAANPPLIFLYALLLRFPFTISGPLSRFTFKMNPMIIQFLESNVWNTGFSLRVHGYSDLKEMTLVLEDSVGDILQP